MRIAIIGSGISGLGAAYLLHPQHDITLYEQNPTLGGHSRTVTVPTPDGDIPVDTGFIVFNHRNYPLLTGLFRHLQVPVAPSDMSFGVSIANGWLEYSTQRLNSLFAQRRNICSPAFLGMVRDILRFNAKAPALLEQDTPLTMEACLQQLGMGHWFRDYYLLAMGAAIWSTPVNGMGDFPAQTFIRFFANHGLLTLNDQPQWYTVQGGSREYIQRLSQPFVQNIRTGCGVQRLVRHADHVELHTSTGETHSYDQVVLATHSDQALRILAEPTAAEQQILGAIRYQPNEMVLHSDTGFMPRRRNAWASWVYLSEQQQDNTSAISLSYWMNNLQPLATGQPMLVTLNPGREPQAALVHDRHRFEHPVFDSAAIAAQGRLAEIQGTHRVWYCGAWQRYGFHEDGLLSAVQVAHALGAAIPWN